MAEHNTKQPKFLTHKDLKAIGISYSREHLWRLEAADKFPRRICFSPQKVVWDANEISGWLSDRAAERDKRVYRVRD